MNGVREIETGATVCRDPGAMAGVTALCPDRDMVVAALGIAAALTLPGRLDRISIGVYAGMGWSVAILRTAKEVPIPLAAFRLVAGGVLVTVALIFHTSRELRFQNAIAHLFVLLRITCHYAAVLRFVLGPRGNMRALAKQRTFPIAGVGGLIAHREMQEFATRSSVSR